MLALPRTVEELLGWDWPQFEPLARELQQRVLDEASLAEWLQDWSDLSAALQELYSRRYVATTVNTADTHAESAFSHFLDVIYPKSMETEQALKSRLLESGLEPAGFETALRNLRAQADLFRAENLPLLAEEHRLSTEYDRISGAQSVPWEGEERTIAQLRPLLQETERARREQAWRLSMQRQLQDRAAFNDLWQRMLDLRGHIAANAGRPDYRAYRWQQLLRFDYTPADCARFQDAIEAAVVPAAQRSYERRRRQLGVDTLRPWDLEVDPLGRPPLRPYNQLAELVEKTAGIFTRLDPQLGAYYAIMLQEGLLDLPNRKHKAPGAYCTAYPLVQRPFIFMNGVGVHDDVETLLHESGHAFHVFESNAVRLMQLQEVPMEFAEVASMSMELLAAPYLAAGAGGFYSPADAARAQVAHLESSLQFWPYMAVVDSFQHWVYQHPLQAADPAQCDAAWDELWQRFMPGVDWTGFEESRRTGWQRKPHIFEDPFYYIEYGLAQLGAVQVWRNSLRDAPAAVCAYRRALALAGSVPLPQLYQAAGARLAFDTETLSEAVALMESRIVELSKLD